VKWYKRFPTDFIEGVALLTLEECGAYTLLLDTLYAAGGALPDNDQALARLWRCNARKARRLKTRLLESGKIQPNDGFLTNRRVTFELNKAKTKSMLMQSLAQKRWGNNGAGHANAYAILDTRYKKERGSSMEDTLAKYRSKPHTVSPELEHQLLRGRKWE
jgi:uncharacterized protein YdaU (DUF1376 family)